MPQRKGLTVRTIAAIKPRSTRIEMPDGLASGLYLVVQPTGARSWAFRYRSPTTGRPRKFTIGPYPAFGLATAREQAGAAARALHEGVDPSDQRKARLAAATATSDNVDRLLAEFTARHVEATNRPSTAAEVRRLISTIVGPAWGTRKVQSITRRDIVALIDQTTDRGAAVTANRVLALVRKFLNWAVERGVLERSPAAGVRAPTVELSRDRILSDQEIRWLWMATEAPTPFNAIVRLLLTTGQRRGEVGGVRRAEIDDTQTPEWHIPNARTKNGRAHTVPLSPLSRAILGDLDKIDGAALVFSTTGVSPISGWSKSKAALDRKMEGAAREVGAAPLPNWRLHDLRRTAASGMARLGQPVHVIEAVLNHRSGVLSGVAGVYNRHDYAKEKRLALAAWSDLILGITATATSSLTDLGRWR